MLSTRWCACRCATSILFGVALWRDIVFHLAPDSVSLTMGFRPYRDYVVSVRNRYGIPTAGLLPGQRQIPTDARDLVDLGDCDFDILMTHTRGPLGLVDSAYAKSLAINFLYSRRHGYNFTLLLMDPGSFGSWGYVWGRVLWLQEKLVEPTARCKWVVNLDNDAFIEQFDMPFADMYAAIFASRSTSANAIFPQDACVPTGLSWVCLGVRKRGFL